ncbi:MAG: NADH-quinone oxidoreductase subunit NuoF [Candidatus Dormibacteraceae bacterium]
MPDLRGSHGPGEGRVLTRDFGTPGLASLAGYESVEGYQALRKALKEMTPAEIIDAVKASGLRGRGGAGFSTGAKWSFIPKDHPGPRYIVCNADESEPGTAKDRYLMENSPHMLIEGICIALFAIGGHQAWVYIRGEYDGPLALLEAAIGEARKKGHLGDDPFGTGYGFDIRLYRGHGAYICGEETALLESLEGKRAQPRARPPYPAIKGAWGQPTAVNNVETLSTLPWIIRNGAAAYARLGTEKSKGTRMFTVSGHVQRPGNYEMELGLPFTHLVNDLAGGPLPGRRIKVFWPGGSSAPVLPGSMLDTPTDLESLAAVKSMGGSGGVIVMDDAHCVVRAAHRLLKFYSFESCGKCTPCRVGGDWAVRTLDRILAGEGAEVDLENLDRIQVSVSQGRCLCGLGDSAGWVIESTMQHFRNEYEEHVLQRACSAERVAAGV